MVRSALELIAGVTAREHALIAAARAEGAGMVEVPDKVAGLVDVSRALSAVGAAWALVGGVAVGIRSGVPRATLATISRWTHAQIGRR